MIISHCDRIINKLKDIKEADFYGDNDLQEIVAFNLFQIGELTSKLSNEFLDEYKEIPWKQIRGLRNRIVHGYDTINLEILWNTALESIRELQDYCEKILNM